MKNPEYFIEFTKALKSKDNVSILNFLINEPFVARDLMYKHPIIKQNFMEWKVGNNFAKRLLTEDNITEDFSIAHNIFREIIARRSFVTGAFTKDAHHHVDFFSQKRGFIQTKNPSEYGFKKFMADKEHYAPNNRPTVNCVDIFTKKDKTEIFDQTQLGKPKFNIVKFQNLKPISLQQIATVEKAFYANESEIIEIQETKMKPLVTMHRKFLENPDNAKVDWTSQNPKFNHKNQAKNELDRNLYIFERKKIVGF